MLSQHAVVPNIALAALAKGARLRRRPSASTTNIVPNYGRDNNIAIERRMEYGNTNNREHGPGKALLDMAFVDPKNQNQNHSRSSIDLDAIRDIDIDALSNTQIDALLSKIIARRKNDNQLQKRFCATFVLPFLQRCRDETRTSIYRLQDDLRTVTFDLNSLRNIIRSGDPNRSGGLSSGTSLDAGGDAYAHNQFPSRRASSSPDTVTDAVTDAVVEAVAHVAADVAADVAASAAVTAAANIDDSESAPMDVQASADYSETPQGSGSSGLCADKLSPSERESGPHVQDALNEDDASLIELDSSTKQDILRRRGLISKFHNDVKAVYFSCRREREAGALQQVLDTLVEATASSCLVKRAMIQHVDIMESNRTLISSIEFNDNATVFATAGVRKCIKVFDFASILEATDAHSQPSANIGLDDSHHYPVVEIPTPTKLSCLSWNHARTSLLASATYNGEVLLHDVETKAHLAALREHTRRAWFVDFSKHSATSLLSGSDDRSVKLWDVRTNQSSITLNTAANVCCVRFNPEEGNEFVFGSADHNVYSYDVRRIESPLCVFEGHWRAVSQVVFLDRQELVSMSTDATCKLWNTTQQRSVLTYSGHGNARNFVGLCASNNRFVCGSEDHAVYLYHKIFSGPVIRYPVTASGAFVSSVAWKPDSPWLVAATNMGNLEILEIK